MKTISKKEWIAVAISLGFIAYAFFGGLLSNIFTALGGNETLMNNSQDQYTAAVAAADTVEARDITTGSGLELAPGMQVAVHYVLKLSDGTVLQDSKQVGGGQPFVFISGSGQLIPGWEMGIRGMRVGGKRMIVIPPELGYGAQGQGPVPPNATLVFEIEVVDAKPLSQ